MDTRLTKAEFDSVTAPIDEARTLPARAYYTEDFFSLETERIFHRHWMALGFDATLPDPGDMRPVELFGMALVIVRGDDRVLRVFHNVCPYDGCLAVRYPIRGAADIEVYYHGWRYDLRGKLTSIPYWNGNPEEKLSALNGREGDLVEIRSATRLGVLFVDLGGAAGDIDTHLAPLLELLAEYDTLSLTPVEDDDCLARDGLSLQTNWKTYVENAAINILHESFTHEAYRVSPEVPRVSNGARTFEIITEGPLMAFGFKLSDFANTYQFGGQTPHLGFTQSAGPTRGFFITLYPNLAMPVRYNMMRFGICLPTSPSSSVVLQCGQFHRDAVRHTQFPAYHRDLVKRYAQVFDEDRTAVEAVQKGRRSPVWQQHVYAPFWDDLHYYFNKLVAVDMS